MRFVSAVFATSLMLPGSLVGQGAPARSLTILELQPQAALARYNPRDARIPLLQAMTAETLDQTDTAREAYSRFLAIAPSRFASQIEESRKRLAQLQ